MKHLMRLLVIVFVASGAQAGSLSELLPGTRQDELQQVKSPDGHSTAILYHKERHGLGLPPEPPKTLDRWARLKVINNGKTVYDSNDERLNIYQMMAGFALDLMWSPDSTHLAYRHITSLRIIGIDGQVAVHNIEPQDSVITSFRWIDKENLLVVSKREHYALEMSGKPGCYQGYIDQAKDIRITRLNLIKGYTECYQQAVTDPTFLFHSINFLLDEISPHADRVAFSDSKNLCVYDTKADKIIVKVKIPQKPTPKPEIPANLPPEFAKADIEAASKPAQLEGIWWQSNERLVIGVGLLGSPVKSFYTYDIQSKALTDVTSSLLPIWDGNDNTRNYQDSDWYRTAIK